MTMTNKVYVNFSGPALAFLLYENAKVGAEQEGFLLGDTNEIITQTTTDEHRENIKKQKVININAVLPCPKTCLFYNNVGVINKAKLKMIIGNQYKNVVAWFKYEPYGLLKLTMRGKNIHRGLSEFFNIEPEFFSCCLLASNSSQNRSTYSYKHILQRYVDNQFETIPIHIDNLGESMNRYKPRVNCTDRFAKMCRSLGLIDRNDYNWESTDLIQDKLQIEIKETMEKLGKSEKIIKEREQELIKLREQLQYKKKTIEMEKLKQQAETTPLALLVLIDEENNKISTDVKNVIKVNETKLYENGDVLVKTLNGDYSKYTMPTNVMNLNDDVLVVECSASSSNSPPTIDEEAPAALIDLTMTDEENSPEENTPVAAVAPPPPATKKKSYAQAMSNTKKKNTV